MLVWWKGSREMCWWKLYCSKQFLSAFSAPFSGVGISCRPRVLALWLYLFTWPQLGQLGFSSPSLDRDASQSPEITPWETEIQSSPVCKEEKTWQRCADWKKCKSKWVSSHLSSHPVLRFLKNSFHLRLFYFQLEGSALQSLYLVKLNGLLSFQDIYLFLFQTQFRLRMCDSFFRQWFQLFRFHS